MRMFDQRTASHPKLEVFQRVKTEDDVWKLQPRAVVVSLKFEESEAFGEMSVEFLATAEP